MAKAKKIKDKKRVMLDLIKRDGKACKVCGAKEELTIDHILKSSMGGSNDMSNLQILCRPCHFKKDDWRIY